MPFDRPIAIALILFIILVLVFFLVAPEYKTFTKLQAELGEKTAEYNAEFGYYNAIAATYADLQSRKDDIAKIDDALPSEPSLGKVVYFLQKTATENGMMIRDLFLSKSSSAGAQDAKTNKIRDIVFSMDVLGSYSSLEKFIIALEKSSRIFEVTNISFGSSGQELGTSQTQFQIQQVLNYNLQIKTHSY